MMNRPARSRCSKSSRAKSGAALADRNQRRPTFRLRCWWHARKQQASADPNLFTGGRSGIETGGSRRLASCRADAQLFTQLFVARETSRRDPAHRGLRDMRGEPRLVQSQYRASARRLCLPRAARRDRPEALGPRCRRRMEPHRNRHRSTRASQSRARQDEGESRGGRVTTAERETPTPTRHS